MTAHDEFDDRLRERFATLREADSRQVPPFGAMIAQARARAAGASVVDHVGRADAGLERRSSRRWALAAIPLAIAAGVTFLLANPDRLAEREFERAVSEWSRTERTLTTPTDGLLAVPGSEYLRRLPSLGAGSGAIRRPS